MKFKKKLELLYEEKTNRFIVRARARWYEHGSTRHFLTLEKRNHAKNTLEQIGNQRRYNKTHSKYRK